MRESHDVRSFHPGQVRTSKKSVGLLLMDQGFWAGVGNIYRAEILFVARVHPSVPGVQLTRDEFDRIWSTSVALMRRGYEQGSILTVDPNPKPHRRSQP